MKYGRKFFVVQWAMFMIPFFVLIGAALAYFGKEVAWLAVPFTAICAIPPGYIGINGYIKGKEKKEIQE